MARLSWPPASFTGTPDPAPSRADIETLLLGGTSAPATAQPQKTPAAQPAAPVSPYGTPPEWTKK